MHTLSFTQVFHHQPSYSMHHYIFVKSVWILHAGRCMREDYPHYHSLVVHDGKDPYLKDDSRYGIMNGIKHIFTSF